MDGDAVASTSSPAADAPSGAVEQPQKEHRSAEAEYSGPSGAAASGGAAAVGGGDENEDEEEEEETCGFCKFMKAGGCKTAFNAWSACVDRGREDGTDFAEVCKDVTLALRECMLAHREYYAPMLEEEEAAMKEAAAAAEAEAAAAAAAAGEQGGAPATAEPVPESSPPAAAGASEK